MKKSIIISTLLLLPFISSAQGLQEYLASIPAFLSSTIIPFLLGIAFLFFVINAIRFFIFGSTSEDGRENAKNLAIYSILAFVLIIVFWGIVNLVAIATGLSGCAQPTSDYVTSNFMGPPQAPCR